MGNGDASQDSPHAHPLDGHRLANDALSSGARQVMAIGNRELTAISDGFLLFRPEALGSSEHPTAGYDALTAEHGEVRLPLGCFFLPGEQNVLIDTGVGPRNLNDTLIGGNLVRALASIGVAPADVDVVALSHLHRDHVGGIADPRTAEPVFVNARVCIGRSDWEYFIDEPQEALPIDPYVREALTALDGRGQVTLLDGDAPIARGVRRLDAPGHTPGHSLYIVEDAGERVMLLGDAMYCPQQLTNLDWGAVYDVDPVLARATRESFERDLELHGGSAVGCHFPGLIAGRALASPSAR